MVDARMLLIVRLGKSIVRNSNFVTNVFFLNQEQFLTSQVIPSETLLQLFSIRYSTLTKRAPIDTWIAIVLNRVSILKRTKETT